MKNNDIFIISHNNKIKSYCDDKDSARNAVQELADLLELEMKNTKKLISRKTIKEQNDNVYQINIYEQDIGYFFNNVVELKHTIGYQICEHEIKTDNIINTDNTDKKVYVVYVYDTETFNDGLCDIEIYDNKTEAKKKEKYINDNNDDLDAVVRVVKINSKCSY